MDKSKSPKLNRLGVPYRSQEPLTPYEEGQIRTHCPTVGVKEMARRLKRSYASVWAHWRRIRLKDKEMQS